MRKYYVNTLEQIFCKALTDDQKEELIEYMDGILAYDDVNCLKNIIKDVEIQLDLAVDVLNKGDISPDDIKDVSGDLENLSHYMMGVNM